MTTFDETVAAVGDVPFMTPKQGRRLWDHFGRFRPKLVFDIGTMYGASAVYMASAMKSFGIDGRVITVDSAQGERSSELDQWCRAFFEQTGVADIVEPVRIEHSSYAWWCMEQVAQRTTKTGRVRADVDFVYLDGAKSLTLDTTSVVFLAQVLRPGGWLLLDDIGWTHEEHPEHTPVIGLGNGATYHFSKDETVEPQLRRVFDLVVEQLPWFDRTYDDGWWGWARRKPSGFGRVRQELGRAVRNDRVSRRP